MSDGAVLQSCQVGVLRPRNCVTLLRCLLTVFPFSSPLSAAPPFETQTAMVWQTDRCVEPPFFATCLASTSPVLFKPLPPRKEKGVVHPSPLNCSRAHVCTRAYSAQRPSLPSGEPKNLSCKSFSVSIRHSLSLPSNHPPNPVYHGLAVVQMAWPAWPSPNMSLSKRALLLLLLLPVPDARRPLTQW